MMVKFQDKNQSLGVLQLLETTASRSVGSPMGKALGYYFAENFVKLFDKIKDIMKKISGFPFYHSIQRSSLKCYWLQVFYIHTTVLKCPLCLHHRPVLPDSPIHVILGKFSEQFTSKKSEKGGLHFQNNSIQLKKQD